MTEVFKLIGTIVLKGQDDVKSELKDVSSTASKSEGMMSKAFKKIGTAVAAAFAVDKIVSFGKACVESAATVKAMNSQFEQTFTQKGIDLTDEAADAIKRVADESNILDTRLQGVGTSIYAFAKTTGMDSTIALDMMERALKVTADSAAYYDRSLEDTAESLKSFLKGNFENDAALGLSCTEFTRNAKAVEVCGKEFKDLSEAQKQLVLLEMVEDANDLSGAMGQASREGSGWENVVGNMKEAWNQFKAVVGTPVMEKLIPVIETMTDKMSTLTEKMKDSSFETFATKVSNMLPASTNDRIAEFNAGISGMIANMKNSIFQSFGDNFGKIKESLQATSPLIQQMGGNYLSMFLDKITQVTSYINNFVVPVFNLWFTVFTDVATAIWEAIAPAVTEISNKFTELSSMVTEAINTYILPTFQMFIGMVQELWNENKDKITKIGELFKVVFETIAVVISTGVEGFKTYIMPFLEWFVSIVQANMGNIKSVFQTVFDHIGGIIDFFVALFKGDFKGMWEAVKTIFQAGVDFIKNTFNTILSLSKQFNAPIVSAIKGIFANVVSGIKEKIDNAKTTVKNGLDAIKGFFDKLKLKLPDIKLPHFKFNGKFDLSKGQVPSIGVEWYAKGAVLNQPTLFGINPKTGRPMVGGEAGAEAIAPIDVLQNYVRQAVAEANANDGSSKMIDLLQQQNELLIAMLQKDTSLKIDGREFGRMVNKYA